MTGALKERDKFPRELSAGENMRILLSRCLVNNPNLLILDEPTVYLDPDEAWDLMCLLRDINRRGVTIIASCHDSELITIMKQRVVTLVAGTVTADNKHMIYDVKASDIFAERKVLQQRALRREGRY